MDLSSVVGASPIFGFLLKLKKNINQKEWPSLIQSLLEVHYDRLYDRSQERNFSAYVNAPLITTSDLSQAGIDAIALQIHQQLN